MKEVSKASEADTAPSSSTVIDELPIVKPSPVAVKPDDDDEPLQEEGDFIDDDFGLSIKREYESLRQQQLQIEEEVNNFKSFLKTCEITSFEFQISSIQKETVVSKPPPPYSPPSPQPSSPLGGDTPRSPRRPPPVKPEAPCYVPSSKTELSNLVDKISKKLLLDRDCLKLTDVDVQDLCQDQPEASQGTESYQTFVRFVTDLVTHLMENMLNPAKEKQNPPWMRQKPLIKQVQSIPEDDEALINLINEQVQVAFHHQKKAEKESLIIRWSHKKRDRVDQVLVRELHAEEAAWTNYDDDEVQVKDELTLVIMDALINDTIQAFSRVLMCSH